ncbi:MAG: hypothetical protein CMP60_01465 [Flavobacteriales bacterium]|nr:hypothetical protein [Flavobacteriales bacterium]|tara:strand:- start:150 stop:518 length:369 start_codon:yes stop_codon:yes gene_type:complete
MKNFNVLTTLLFCIFFVNISISQTVKKQQINKELLTNNTKTDPNIKSADVLSDEQKSVSLIQKKTQKLKKIDFNIESSKVKMISPSNVVPNTTQGKNIRIKKGNLNGQQKKHKPKPKQVQDE